MEEAKVTAMKGDAGEAAPGVHATPAYIAPVHPARPADNTEGSPGSVQPTCALDTESTSRGEDELGRSRPQTTCASDSGDTVPVVEHNAHNESNNDKRDGGSSETGAQEDTDSHCRDINTHRTSHIEQQSVSNPQTNAMGDNVDSTKCGVNERHRAGSLNKKPDADKGPDKTTLSAQVQDGGGVMENPVVAGSGEEGLPEPTSGRSPAYYATEPAFLPHTHLESGTAQPGRPSYTEATGGAEVPLTFVDFVPLCINGVYQSYGLLMTQASTWLANHPGYKVKFCECVERSLLTVEGDPTESVFFERSHLYRKFVRTLRLWVSYRPYQVREPTLKVKYITVVPSVESAGGAGKAPALLPLDRTILRFNAKLRTQPIPGRLVNVETQESLMAENQGPCDPDDTFHEERERSCQYYTFIRAYYVEGPASFQDIARKPEQINTHATYRKSSTEKTIVSLRYLRLYHTQVFRGSPPPTCAASLSCKTFLPRQTTEAGIIVSEEYESQLENNARLIDWMKKAGVPPCRVLGAETLTVRLYGGNQNGDPEQTLTSLSGGGYKYYLVGARLYLTGDVAEPPDSELLPAPRILPVRQCCVTQ